MAINDKWLVGGTKEINFGESSWDKKITVPKAVSSTAEYTYGDYVHDNWPRKAEDQVNLVDTSYAYCAADSNFAMQKGVLYNCGYSGYTANRNKKYDINNEEEMVIGFSHIDDLGTYANIGIYGGDRASNKLNDHENTPLNNYLDGSYIKQAGKVYGGGQVPIISGLTFKDVVVVPIIMSYKLTSGGDPATASKADMQSIQYRLSSVDAFLNKEYMEFPYIMGVYAAVINVNTDDKTLKTGLSTGPKIQYMINGKWTIDIDVFEDGVTPITYYPVYGDENSNAATLDGWYTWDGSESVWNRVLSMHPYRIMGYYNNGNEWKQPLIRLDGSSPNYSSTGKLILTGDWIKTDILTVSSSEHWVKIYSDRITASNVEAFCEYVRRQIAYLGCVFSCNGLINQMDYRFIDDESYMGVIDGSGKTHGDYTRGLDNTKNPQYNWTDPINDTPFTPGGGGGDRPKPDPDKNPVLPGRPGFSLATSSGSKTYTISSSEFQQMWDDIYNRENAAWEDLLEGLSLFGSNPLNAILAYRWYPFTLGGSGQSPLILGRTIVNDSHKYAYISNDNDAFYSSSGSFWYGADKNFINSKHCKCRLWLPFYGFVELPMSQMLSKELEIAFQYNAPDDLAVWIISFGDVIYDYYECAPYIEIPITGDNSTQIAIAKQQQAINTALTIGNAAVTIGAGIAAGVATGGFGLIADAFSGGFVGGLDILAHAASYGIPASEMMGIATGLGAIGTGLNTAAKAGGNIVSGRTQTANQVGTLSTNVPTKAGASATTFLHLPMKPYIQFYTNIDMETVNIAQYKRTVGIACEQWSTIGAMPDNSLLSISNPVFDTSGMTENEVNALVTALGGFVK